MRNLPTTFVEVFDLKRVDLPAGRSTVARKGTTFSFTDQGGRRHNVSIHGHPHVESGMSVIAVLGEADDWNSLVGWVNQTTHEIAGPEPINLPLAMVATFAGISGCILALLSNYEYLGFGFGLATVSIVIWMRAGSRRYGWLAALRPRSKT